MQNIFSAVSDHPNLVQNVAVSLLGFGTSFSLLLSRSFQKLRFCVALFILNVSTLNVYFFFSASKTRSLSYAAINNIAVDETLGAMDLLKPVVVTPLPVQKKEKTGKTLRLLCLITGYPPLEICWYLNNELLEEKDSKTKHCSKISFENNRRELVIENLTIKDCGVLRFEARNKYGVVKSSCKLIVEEKKAITVPPIPQKFRKILTKVTSR